MELTQEQSMAMDFIGDQQNTITRDGKSDLWKKNIMENRGFFMQGNPELKGMTGYIVCAGPSLDKNIAELKFMSERGMIVCVDAAFRFCVKNSIIPEYCLMIDGSEKMVEMMEGVDTSKTTLVCTPSASPKIVSGWKGPKYFVTTPYVNIDKKFNLHHYTRIVKAKKDIKAGDELLLDEEYMVEFEGVKATILCGGNVSTAAHHFAMIHLKVHQVVFVGLDLSWEFDSHHYAGAEHQQNVEARTKPGMGSTHLDIDKKEVFTNLSLMSFKRWHETFAQQFPGSTVNATEGGILGVEQKGDRADYIEFLTLKEAIEKYTPKKGQCQS